MNLNLRLLCGISSLVALCSTPLFAVSPSISVLPVTLSLTITESVGGFANGDGQKTTSKGDSVVIDQYKTKFVTSKYTNASLLAELIQDDVIQDKNWTLIISSNGLGDLSRSYLVRPYELKTGSFTTPNIKDVTSYLAVTTSFYTTISATNAKKVTTTIDTVETATVTGTAKIKGLAGLTTSNSGSSYGLLNGSLKPVDGNTILYTSAKITGIGGIEIDGGHHYIIGGTVSLGAAKPADSSVFPPAPL